MSDMEVIPGVGKEDAVIEYEGSGVETCEMSRDVRRV